VQGKTVLAAAAALSPWTTRHKIDRSMQLPLSAPYQDLGQRVVGDIVELHAVEFRDHKLASGKHRGIWRLVSARASVLGMRMIGRLRSRSVGCRDGSWGAPYRVALGQRVDVEECNDLVALVELERRDVACPCWWFS